MCVAYIFGNGGRGEEVGGGGRLLGGGPELNGGTHSDKSAYITYLEYQKPYLLQGDERQEQEQGGRKDSEHGEIDLSSCRPLNFEPT